MRKTQITLIVLGALVAAGIWFYYFQLVPYAASATGFVAKTYCSARYVSGRSPLSILDEELSLPDVRFVAVHEDPQLRRVSARVSLDGVYGDGDYSRSDFASTAVYRPGMGCTLATGVDAEALAANRIDSPDIRSRMPWQLRTAPLPKRIQDGARDYVRGQFERDVGTRALLVWHRDALAAEAYAPGVEPTTPLIGWSMGKSVVQALVGIAVGEEWMSVEDTGLRESWAGGDRAQISLDNLLRMSSGLRFDETYQVGHDAVSMLFNSRSAAEYAERMPLDAEPGSHWQYSSGTTNILSAVLGDRVRTEAGLSPAQFARRYLFDRIGAPSFLLETDASGQLVGSSFAWATARDWLRFGLLYLYDGELFGERVLPEGWASYAASYTPGSGGQYGAHFWVNHADEVSGERPMPSLPPDSYHASGFDGQSVVVIPSRQLVVVRLGWTPSRADWELNTHLPPLLEVLEDD